MNTKKFRLALVAGLMVTATAHLAALPTFPFQEISLEQARQQARQQDKLFILYFTANWCLPCRWMEANTFADPELSAFVSDHYLAVKVDLNKPGSRVLQQQFEVNILPSLLVFAANGQLIDQRSASQEAAPLLRWLKRLDKPANHLTPVLLPDASARPALNSPRAEVNFTRPALVTDPAPALLTHHQNQTEEPLLVLSGEPLAAVEPRFSPRSSKFYGILLHGDTYDYTAGIRMIVELERKYEQKAELYPLGEEQFQCLVGHFETTGQAQQFLQYLNRNNRTGEIIILPGK
jgi:thiol-disulfide isomerase/thioredoxin